MAAHRPFTAMLVFVVVGGVALALWLPEGELGLALAVGYGVGYGIYLSLSGLALARILRRRD